MLTVVYRVTVKKGKEKEFKKIARLCEKSAHESKECLRYTFFVSLNSPREFIVHYEFADKRAQNKHIQNLQKKIGPAQGKYELPDKFLNLLDDEEIVLMKRH